MEDLGVPSLLCNLGTLWKTVCESDCECREQLIEVTPNQYEKRLFTKLCPPLLQLQQRPPLLLEVGQLDRALEVARQRRDAHVVGPRALGRLPPRQLQEAALDLGLLGFGRACAAVVAPIVNRELELRITVELYCAWRA